MLLCWGVFVVGVLWRGMAAEGRPEGRPEGFHFARFSGPVSGPVAEVEVGEAGPPGGVYGRKASVDYVAKPDYSFAYGVQDPESGNYQNQKETRDGDVVRGEYTVVEADGSTRRVVYTADPQRGFQATVHLSEPDRERAARQESFVRTLAEASAGENGSY